MDSFAKIIPGTLILFLFVTASCRSQTINKSKLVVGGGCEGCEAIYEYGDKNLIAKDTLPEFQKMEPKLKITGIVYQQDGSTPAENVILYIYHTNRAGIYETRGNEKGRATSHGIFRGWIKTDRDGEYTFFTFRPASYPDRSEPEHIHLFVKEPYKGEYYLDNYVFDDDPLLTPDVRRKLQNMGGSGIVILIKKDAMLTIRRNIILGHNVPGYE